MGSGKYFVSVPIKFDVDDELEELRKKLEKVVSDASSEMTGELGDGFKSLESNIKDIKKAIDALGKTQAGSSEYEKAIKSLQTQFDELSRRIDDINKKIKSFSSSGATAGEIDNVSNSLDSLNKSIKDTANSVSSLNNTSGSFKTNLKDNLEETKKEAKETAAAMKEVADGVKVYKNQINSTTTNKKGKKQQALSWTEFTDFFQTVTKNATVKPDGTLNIISEKVRTNYEALEKEITKVDKKIIDLMFDMGKQGDETSASTGKQIDLLREYLALLERTRNKQISSPAYLADQGHAQTIDFVRGKVQVAEYNSEITKVAKTIDSLREKIANVDKAGISSDYAQDLDNADKSLENLAQDLQDFFNQIKANNGQISDVEFFKFFNNYKKVMSSVDDTLGFAKVDKQIAKLKNDLIEINTAIASSGKNTDVSALKRKRDELEKTVNALVSARNAELQLTGASANSYDNATASIAKYNEEIISATESLSKMREKISSLMADESRSAAFKSELSNLSNDIRLAGKELDDAFILLKQNPFDTNNLNSFRIALAKVTETTEQYNKVVANSTTSKAYAATREDVQKLDNQISAFLDQNTAAANRFKQELLAIQAALRGSLANGVDMSKFDLSTYSEQVNRIQSEVKSLHQTGNSFFTSLKKQLQSANAQFIGTYLSIQDFIRYGKEIFDTVKNINSALTELRKVSDATTERLVENFETSAKTAKELGDSVKDVINMTADWARLGYDVDAAEELARVTTLFKNVGDDMSAETASEYMISALQGFQIAAEDAERIVDAYNEVANNYAIDTAGIGEALERSAASFNAANTSMEKAIALVTATNEVVQNPESVGTLWKTMSARIRGAKTELEELGEEEDQFTQTTSKLRDLVMGLTGFDILEEDGETFKDIYEIILGIGKEWDKLTDIEQASLGEALAGKRNANAFYAVIGNLETLQEAYETASNSAGSAAKEQENFAKSIQYSLNKLEASFEVLAADLLDSQFAKGLVEFLTSIVNFLDAIVENVGVLIPLLTTLGGLSIIKNIDNIRGLIDLGKSLTAIEEATKLLDPLLAAGAATDVLANSLKGLTIEQSANLLASKGLTKAKIEEILVSQGADIEIAKETALRATLTNTTVTQTKSTISLSAAYKGLAASIGLSTTALTTILGVGALVVAAIGIGVAAWDHYTISTEEATEALANFKEESDTLKSNLESHKQLVRDVADRYEELAQGVDTLTNKNLTLSDDDYKEFLDITTQLGEAFPELIKSSDEYGGYILTIGDNYKYAAEELRGYLNEEQKRYYYQQYKDLPEYTENAQVMLDSYQDQVDLAQRDLDIVNDKIKAVAKLKETIEATNGSTDTINLTKLFDEAGISYTARNEALQAFQEYFEREWNMYDLDSIVRFKSIEEGGNDEWILDLSNVNEENREAIDEYFRNIVVEYGADLTAATQELSDAKANYDAQWVSLRQTLSDALQFQLSGDSISDTTRDLAEQYASTWTSEFIEQFADAEGKVDYQALVNNFAAEFKKLDVNQQVNLSKLFSTDISPEEKVKIYEELQAEFEKLGIKIPLDFVIADEKDVTERLRNKISQFVQADPHSSIPAVRDFRQAQIEEAFSSLFNELGIDTVEEYNKILSIIAECEDWEEALQKVRDEFGQINETTAAFSFNSLTDAVSDVNKKLLPQFRELGELYDEVFNGDNGFDLSGIGADDLDGIAEAFNNLDVALNINPPTEEVERFVSVIGDSSSTAKEVQDAFNGIATAYFNAAVEAGNFSKENAAVLEQMLKEMGIVNADEVVDYYTTLAEAQKLVADNGWNLVEADKAMIDGWVEAVGASEETANALYILALKQIFLNENWVNEENSIAQVLALADAAGIATEAVGKLGDAQANISSLLADLKETNDPLKQAEIANAIKDAREDAKAYAEEIQDEVNNFSIDFSHVGSSSGSKGSAGSAGKDAADEYVEAFEEELEALEKQRDAGIISEKEFLERYKDLIERYFKDVDGYAEEYAERMHDYFDRLTSYYENVFSAIGTILSHRISALEKAKSAAVASINAEKEAAAASYQAQIDYIDGLIDAKEAEIDAIDKEIDRYQDQIDAIDKQIDALEEANQKRQQAINLQKAQYELEKAQNQRTKLIYKGGQLVYENDTSAVRDAKENLEDAEFEIQKQKLEDLKKPLEEQIELLEKRKELIQDEIDGLQKQQEAIQKAMEASNKYYEQMIKETEAYWDALIEKLEDTKSKFEQIAELRDLAEAIDLINSYLGDTKYTIEDVWNGSPELIDQMLQDFINALMGANSANEDFKNSLALAAQEMGLSFDQISQGAKDTENNLNPLADALSPLTQASVEIGDTADALGEVATNSEKAASNTKDVATNATTAASALDEEAKNADSAYDSLDKLSDLNLATVITQMKNLADAINDVATALGLTEDSPISAIETAITNLSQMSLGEESTGIIGSFYALETAVNAVTSAIGSGGGASSGEADMEAKSAGMDAGANDGGNGGLIGAIGELHTATDEHVGTSAEDEGSEEGGTVISDFNALKAAVEKVAETIGLAGENGEAPEGSLLGIIQTMPDVSEEPINTVKEFFNELCKAISDCVTAVGELLDGISRLGGAGFSISSSGGGIYTGNVHIGEATGNVHAGNAYASGKLGIKKSENALVGEIGRELVYNPATGTYRTVGDHGPEITRLNKGDLIFNAEQTKAIIKHGKRDHGHSYAGGNSEFMPLTSAEIEMFKKMGSAVEGIKADVDQMLEPVKSLTRGATYNTTNNNPVINISDTHFDIQGVTGEQVARQISDTFEGMISHAYQRAMKK